MRTIFAALLLASVPLTALAITPVATYEFNNTFAANEPGLPALVPTDPLGTSLFQTDTVLGNTRPVWTFNGNNSPANQSGFTLNTTGLVSPESYSVDMVFQFTDRPGAWRRILDVQNRQSDNGFYVDPSNNLDIFPIAGSSAAWTNNVYHHVVLTDNGTTVTTYLDGISQFSANTSEMNLDFDPTNNPSHLLGAFLDNVAASGTGEWSSGSVALFRIWNTVLTPDQAQQIALNPFIPEPASLSLLGCTAFLFLRKRRS